jgi:hypothetical protein
MVSKSLNFAAAVRKDMFARADTQDMIVAEMSKNGMLLQHVKHQNSDICLAAIRQNWRALQFVRDIKRCIVGEYCIVTQAIRCSPEAASLLPPAHHLYAVCTDIRCIDFIAKPSMECCRYVITKMPEWISKLPNPPMELCLLAVQGRFKDATFKAHCNVGYYPAINYLRRDYLEGIQVSGTVLAELQEAALAPTKGWALLNYPQDVQVRLIEAAVRLNPVLYAHVPHLHTDALNHLACKLDPKLLAHVTNPTRELVWETAASWHVAIKYAEEQDEGLCVHAVRKSPAAIAYVRKQRLHIWAKAGYKTLPPLTSLFPEFVPNMKRCTATHAFFKRIQIVMSQQAKPTTKTVELEDPVTMEPVAAGTVCAFLADAKGTEHFAGTLDSLLDLLRAGFRGSTVYNIFVPIKNTLIPTNQLKWHMV